MSEIDKICTKKSSTNSYSRKELEELVIKKNIKLSKMEIKKLKKKELCQLLNIKCIKTKKPSQIMTEFLCY